MGASMGLRKLKKNLDNDYVNTITSYSFGPQRFIWFVLCLGMLAASVYLAYQLIDDYLQYNSYTEISSEFASEYHLPAITICNMNKYNRTKMEEKEIMINGNSWTVYELYASLSGDYDDRSTQKVEKNKYDDDRKEKEKEEKEEKQRRIKEQFDGQKQSKQNKNIEKRGAGARNENYEKSTTNVPYEYLNRLSLEENYKWDIWTTFKQRFVSFSKEQLDVASMNSIISEGQTEMGNCLEINDVQSLVQKTGGPVGGFSIILDTQTEHYLDNTPSEGFYVVLRMPNETVLHREYAFTVSPGKEVHIQLNTVEVTRLGSRHGTCKEVSDLFKDTSETTTEKIDDVTKNQDTMTFKECYTKQILWQYLTERMCKCYPSYIFTRYLKKKKPKNGTTPVDDVERDDVMENRLLDHFTKEVEEGKRIKFENVCYYQDYHSYAGELLETIASSNETVGTCTESCQKHEGCVYFQFVPARKISDGPPAEWADPTCELFDETATETILDYKVTRGRVECPDEQIAECKVTTQAICENQVIENMVSENETARPPKCYEPCNYNNTLYSLSESNFPSRRFWITKLEEEYPEYRSFLDARNNLVKLVFYQEVLKRNQEIQTAAYSISSLFGEFNGIIDGFIGISFFTVFKLVEWLFLSFTSCCRTRRLRNGSRSSAKSKDDAENISINGLGTTTNPLSNTLAIVDH